MSSRPLLIIMALTSFLIMPGGSLKASQVNSVADLLLRDEVDQAEALLDKQPRTAETIAFRGEIEFRRGDFAKANSLYREALQLDDKTARGHFGLGKLALARLQGKAAVAELKRAVELAPNEAIFHLYAAEAYGIEKNYTAQKTALQAYMKLNISDDPDRAAEARAALEMLNALGGKDIGVAHAPENPKPIPFQTNLNLIFAQVMIDGKGPFRFVVDTGATQVVVSEKLAANLALKPITTTIMHGVGGGGRVESKLFGVKEFAIGDVKVTNLPVGTFNDPLVAQLADGILGTAILADFVTTINYPDHQIELSKKAPAVTATSESLQAWYFSNLLLVPIEVNGKFHGNFVVDTGAVATVLSHSMAAKLGVTEKTPGAKVEMGVAGVGGMEGLVLRVEDVTFTTTKNSEAFPQVVSIDLKQISKMIGTEVSGVLGFDFLEGYKVMLNYSNGEIRLIK